MGNIWQIAQNVYLGGRVAKTPQHPSGYILGNRYISIQVHNVDLNTHSYSRGDFPISVM